MNRIYSKAWNESVLVDAAQAEDGPPHRRGIRIGRSLLLAGCVLTGSVLASEARPGLHQAASRFEPRPSDSAASM